MSIDVPGGLSAWRETCTTHLRRLAVTVRHIYVRPQTRLHQLQCRLGVLVDLPHLPNYLGSVGQ